MTATSTRTIVVLGQVGDTDRCPASDCLRLAESHDGGATYSPLPVPEATYGRGNGGPSEDTALDIRFGSGQDGWIFGGGLWATHDGGQTWSRVGMPGKVLRLEAAAGTAWALVSVDRTTQHLWRSPVGEDDWQEVPDVEVTGPADLAVQAERVTVVGAENSPAWSNASGDFKRVENPCNPSLAVQVSASGGLWAKCTTGMAAYLAESADGVTWAKVQFDAGGGMPPNSMVVGARMSGEALVWLGNGDTPLSRLTSDGKLTPVASPPGTGISWMGFTTKDIGYATTCCSIQTLLRTEDGGDTWTEAGPQ